MNVGNKPTAILSQNSSEGIQSSPCATPSILAFRGRAGGVAHGASLGSRGQSWLGVNAVRCGADTVLYVSIYIGY